MKIIILHIFLFLSMICGAQEDAIQLQADIGLRGKWQTGNFAQFVINPHGSLMVEKRKMRVEVQANYEFLKVNSGNLINDFWTFGLYQNNPSKNVFPMAIVHYGFAKSFAIDYSLVSGIGAGANLWNDSEDYIQTNIFFGYLNLKYDQIPTHEAPTIGSYVKIKIPLKKDKVYCLLDSHAYMSFKNREYHSFNSRLVVQFQIVKNFGVNMTYSLVYNNNNPLVITKTNGKLVFGFNYHFK